MATVIVTGASGHLGANLVRALLARGEAVRVLIHHDTRALAGLPVQHFRGDVCDPDSLLSAFAGADIVYHAAGRISLRKRDAPQLQAVNVEGVRNVLSAFRASGAHRLIHFSSIHALQQKPLHLPVTEDRPLVLGGGEAYDRSKAAGERLVREAMTEGLDACILYPTGIIGPHDYHPSHMGAVLLTTARGGMPALVRGGFDWVDARDVAAGAMAAAEHAPSGSRYLLSGHWVSIAELARMVESLMGRRRRRMVVPIGLARLAAHWMEVWPEPRGRRAVFTPASLAALRGNPSISHVKAARELGYCPRPIVDTVRDTLQWFTQFGMLLADG